MIRFLKKAGVFIAWILVWQICYTLIHRDILVASPAAVAQNLIGLLQSQVFYLTLLNTMKNILLGFLSALVIGSALAVVTNAVPFLKAFIMPMVGVIKVTPPVSFIILALIYIKSGNLPPVISFLMVMPLVWGNMTKALQAVDQSLLEMSRVFHVPFYLQIKNIYLPAAIPYFLAAFQTGFGYAWKSGVTAEVMAAPSLTIGKALLESKIYLETTGLFSWTIVIIIVSILMEKLLVKGVEYLINSHYPNYRRSDCVD